MDNQDGYGEYYWARRSCQAYTGNYSGWAVGGGVDGSTLDCGSSYPDNVRSQMISSAFSLADATAADMTFQRWHNTDSDNDRLFWGASTDGFNFNGWEISGDSGGWQQQIFDLTDVPNLGDLSSKSIVSIMIGFIRDSGVNHPAGCGRGKCYTA